MPRGPSGAMTRPLLGGSGCPARVDNIRKHTPGHAGGPRVPRRCDVGPGNAKAAGIIAARTRQNIR
eukprot:3598934-Pyramimonas_sp.AAC.1